MADEKSVEVKLYIDDQVFKVDRNVLCEHSDYFRAMFSGGFREQEKQDIVIDVVEASSMVIIVKYMTLGSMDLNGFSLQTIGNLANAANFLQITGLITKIECHLEQQLSKSNWLEIMTIAENASYKKIQEQSAAFGLYNFRSMKPEFIKPIEKLVWYLSHTHLNSESELQVFKFGFDWMSNKVNSADVLLPIIGCLDISRVMIEDLIGIRSLIQTYENSLAVKVVDCLYQLATDFDVITIAKVKDSMEMLCKMFSERVYTETLNIVTSSTKRDLKLKPCVAVWSRDLDPEMLKACPHYLYTLHDVKGIDKWLEVTEKSLWGWKFVAWGVTKIVIVCGERGKGTGLFWRGVKHYNVLKKKWTEHGVELPLRRHGGVAILDDSLYIIGGVGGYRVVLDSAIIYDLKQRSYRKIAKFPDAIQSPTVCVHARKVYASSHKNIYCYEEHGETDRWAMVLETDIRLNCMVSYRGYIYCTQSYFKDLYRFRPYIDTKLHLITCFEISPSTMCFLGNRLLAFESTDATQLANLTIEEYTEENEDGTPTVIWCRDNSPYIINDVAGSCAVVDSLPSVKFNLSEYLKERLANYEQCCTMEVQ